MDYRLTNDDVKKRSDILPSGISIDDFSYKQLKEYADGYIELWDVYYTTTVFTTLTYNNVNYTNAVEFKVEFAGTPNLRAGCVSTSSNECHIQNGYMLAVR